MAPKKRIEMKTIKQIRRESVRETFQHWDTLAMATVVIVVLIFIGAVMEPAVENKSLAIGFFVALLGVYTLAGVMFTVLVEWPISYSYEQMFLSYTRDRNIDVLKHTFSGFQDMRRAIVLTFLMEIYTLLWALLLIVPGIMRYYSYRLSYFVALDHPNWVAERCLYESRIMMRGHRWELFKLDISFIGWMLLTVLTCGIGLLWLSPMMGIATAKFYEELRHQQQGASIAQEPDSVPATVVEGEESRAE